MHGTTCLQLNSQRNLVELPWLQRLTYKAIGFPIPFLPVGLWGLLPLPAPTGLRFVVGDPIELPHTSHTRAQQQEQQKHIQGEELHSHKQQQAQHRPSEEDVAALHSHKQQQAQHRPSEADVAALHSHKQQEAQHRPSEEDVAALHSRFYEEVARLFEKHRHGFKGYEDVRLVFVE
jgi:hypothetical protein